MNYEAIRLEPAHKDLLRALVEYYHTLPTQQQSSFTLATQWSGDAEESTIFGPGQQKSFKFPKSFVQALAKEGLISRESPPHESRFSESWSFYITPKGFDYYRWLTQQASPSGQQAEEHASLRRQLADAEENLRLIRERKGQYVMSTDIPLQLLKEEQVLVERIGDLKRQLGEPGGPAEGNPPAGSHHIHNTAASQGAQGIFHGPVTFNYGTASPVEPSVSPIGKKDAVSEKLSALAPQLCQKQRDRLTWQKALLINNKFIPVQFKRIDFEPERRSSPSSRPIDVIFDDLHQQMLILGEAGAGKTMLQELARRLLERYQSDHPRHRIPVDFSLDSWDWWVRKQQRKNKPVV